MLDKKMTRRYAATITTEDIGRKWIDRSNCPCCDSRRQISVRGLMGEILPHDVGKRIYEVNGYVYQVENQEQLEKRLSEDV